MQIDHQTVIKNGKLYIDGGLQAFVENNWDGAHDGNITASSNENAFSGKSQAHRCSDKYLIEIDMSESWDWKKNLSTVALNKTENPDTGSNPPQVVRGALYAGRPDHNKIYLYGGTTSLRNTSFPGWLPQSSAQYTLWSYDTLTKEWDQYDVSDAAPLRPTSGAYAEAPEQGLAFYFNGQIDQGSAVNTQLLGPAKRFLKGMIAIDTNNQTARNISTDLVVADYPRTRGKMAYLPGAGEKGILAILGGSSKHAEDNSDKTTGQYVPMDEVIIFDINSLYNGDNNGTWYKQKVTGAIPEPRIDFCLVAISAPDNSSHNIYMYGGRDSASVFDDIYILSVPSFTWTRIYQGQSPRAYHTCHVAGNRQMITIGGDKTTKIEEGCDWETKSVAVYDLTELKWGSVFNAKAASYEVPKQLSKIIGGGAQGRADITAPKDGFQQKGLAQLFGQQLDDSEPTPPDVSKGITGGAIAGIVIGVIAAFAMVSGGIFFVYRRRRTRGQNELKPQGEPFNSHPAELLAPHEAKPQTYELPPNTRPVELPGEAIAELPPSYQIIDSTDRSDDGDNAGNR
ncbi:hypothetical protein FQN51_008470 [Onygenales sp. PD_10]|nr:hypothetical protein FQN51_008470 [Onygenales sp. PD_10]